VKPCPACNKCPALPPAAAPCPACPKQRECPKPPPPCPKQQQQQQQKQQGADDGEGQHDADEDAKAAEKKGDGGGGAKPAADAPPQERPLRLPWAPLLSASEVQRGVGYHGSGRRLEALAAKLLRGEPIRAYTIGGSVTCGSGSSSDAASYPGRFFQFINATFPHRCGRCAWLHRTVPESRPGTGRGGPRLDVATPPELSSADHSTRCKFDVIRAPCTCCRALLSCPTLALT
jgi:hypothetical protein